MAHQPKSELEFLVRDYECDLQGIVNNAVYLNYLEHARHQFLKSIGIDFAQLHQAGTELVVSRIEVDYKFPLTSGDRFVVNTHLRGEGRVRFAFDQDIFRLPERKRILAAKVIGACLQDGKPVVPINAIPELQIILQWNADNADSHSS
jgi:acyl-CoA thioester hydrolase